MKINQLKWYTEPNHKRNTPRIVVYIQWWNPLSTHFNLYSNSIQKSIIFYPLSEYGKCVQFAYTRIFSPLFAGVCRYHPAHLHASHESMAFIHYYSLTSLYTEPLSCCNVLQIQLNIFPIVCFLCVCVCAFILLKLCISWTSQLKDFHVANALMTAKSFEITIRQTMSHGIIII